jgi:cytochrome c oxidase subunit 2
MKPNHVILPALIVSVMALAGSAATSHADQSAASQQQQEPPAPPVREIELKATKYEFTPAKVEVPVGTTVRFKVTAADRDHGFEIQGAKDKCIKIKKGETGVYEYKAEKAGTFQFECCDFCGLGHGRMKGSLVVK